MKPAELAAHISLELRTTDQPKLTYDDWTTIKAALRANAAPQGGEDICPICEQPIFPSDATFSRDLNIGAAAAGAGNWKRFHTKCGLNGPLVLPPSPAAPQGGLVEGEVYTLKSGQRVVMNELGVFDAGPTADSPAAGHAEGGAKAWLEVAYGDVVGVALKADPTSPFKWVPLYEHPSPDSVVVPREPAEGGADYKALYFELLMCVGNKYLGETRHQTALRYLRNVEQLGTGEAAAPKGDK